MWRLEKLGRHYNVICLQEVVELWNSGFFMSFIPQNQVYIALESIQLSRIIGQGKKLWLPYYIPRYNKDKVEDYIHTTYIENGTFKSYQKFYPWI